ncbi:Mur ligase family protein [Mesorhizobium atlanticum]
MCLRPWRSSALLHARARRPRSSRSPARPARRPPRKRCAMCCRRSARCTPRRQSFNNHWGVPLTLARMPQDCDYAVFEIGMNTSGRDQTAGQDGQAHVAIVTMIAAAHLGFFKNLDEIAMAKAEIFEGIEPGGAALLNRDDPRWKLPWNGEEAGVEHVFGFGENARSAFRLVACELHADHSDIAVKVGKRTCRPVSGRPAAISCRTFWRCSAPRNWSAPTSTRLRRRLRDPVGRARGVAGAMSSTIQTGRSR